MTEVGGVEMPDDQAAGLYRVAAESSIRRAELAEEVVAQVEAAVAAFRALAERDR